MEDDQQGLLIPIEVILLGFAAHLTSGNSIETIEDEALYNLQAALQIEIEKRGAVIH